MEIEEVLVQAEVRDVEEALRLLVRWEESGFPLPDEFGILRYNTAGFPQFLVYARRGGVTVRRLVDVVAGTQLGHLRLATLEIAKSLAEATPDKKEPPQETERTDRV